MKNKISVVLQNCQSQAQVVELINSGGTTHYDANEIAGQYAFIAAKENGCGYEIENAEAHLSCLSEAGANFDCVKAIKAFVDLENDEIDAAGKSLGDLVKGRLENRGISSKSFEQITNDAM